MIAEQNFRPVSRVATGFRYALVAFAWLFALGGIIQVFLIGLYLFDAKSSYLSDHMDFGHIIGLLAYFLPVWALLGRVGRKLIGHAVFVLVIYLVQITLPFIDVGWIAALHAVNAFVVIGSAGSLGRATLDLIQAQHQPRS